jgi:hypothetical protein
LALPATRSAIATACFCGRPAAFSALMLDEIVARDDPFFSGMAFSFSAPACANRAAYSHVSTTFG